MKILGDIVLRQTAPKLKVFTVWLLIAHELFFEIITLILISLSLV